MGFCRQCQLPWLFCRQIHNPQRLSCPNSLAQKTEQNSSGLDPFPKTPEVGECIFYKTEMPISLSSLPPLLVHSPKGLLQYVINFTFPVCRKGEWRLCPSSGPACPRGHQLKALIGQQYIKVAPRSRSSERQESFSWAFVSNKYRNTEEARGKNTSTKTGVSRVLYRADDSSASAFAGSPCSHSSSSARQMIFLTFLFRGHLTYSPQRAPPRKAHRVYADARTVIPQLPGTD